MSYQRISYIDFYRGVATILMILFHFIIFYDLHHNTTKQTKIPFQICANISRFLYIFLVGFSFYLSKKHTNTYHHNRITLMILCSLIMTFLSMTKFSHKYVRFGILHYITFSIIFMSMTYKQNSTTPLYISIFLFLIYNLILKGYTSNNIILTSLGVTPRYDTVDYFPITKWLWLTCLGLVVSSKISNKLKNKSKKPQRKCIIRTIGKNSLEIYMIHFVIIEVLQKLI